MNEILQKRRELFRTEIRRQSLEQTFHKKRSIDQILIKDLQECQNLEEFEKKYNNEIQTLILNLLQNPNNENIQKLSQLILQLSSNYTLYLIDNNIFETLKHSHLDMNLIIQIIQIICQESQAIKHIFVNQLNKERFTQFLNDIGQQLYQEHQQQYWQLMFIISHSHYTPFPFLKQIFLVCCEEIIQQRNETTQLQVKIFPLLIQKYPQANQFFWEALNQQDSEQRKPWKCLLYFLKQPNSDVLTCEQFLLTIQYLLQSSNKIRFNQIVTPELLLTIQSNLIRHERTLIRSIKLLHDIFEQDCSLCKLIIEDLVKCLEITIFEGQIEILRTFEVILKNEQAIIILIKQFDIVEILFKKLRQNISGQFNYLILQCLANILSGCSQIQLFYIASNSEYKKILENYVYDTHRIVQQIVEFILNTYFDN